MHRDFRYQTEEQKLWSQGKTRGNFTWSNHSSSIHCHNRYLNSSEYFLQNDNYWPQRQGGAVISCRDIDSFTMTLLGKQVDTKRGTSTESHRGHWSCLLMSPSGLWPHFLYTNLTIHHVVIPESLQFCLDNPACMPYCTGITVAGRSYHPLIVIVTGLGLSSLLLLLLSLLYFTIFLYVVFVVIVVSVFKSYFIAFPFDMTSQSKWPQICLVFVFILSIRVRIQKMRLHNYSYQCGFPLQLLPTLATCDLLSHHNSHVI